MDQDRSREEYKPTVSAQLGQFSKLPPELRFQIWNYLFDDFKSTSIASGPIAILFCNRSLYEETSRILYEHRVFSLTINIDSWIEDSLEFTAIVEVIKGARTPIAVKCIQLSCLDDVLRLIQQSPSWRLQRCGPCIRVRYFYSLSPSKELCLWKCVHSIVDTLKLIPNGKHMRFTTFHPRSQKPRHTMELTKSGVLKDWFDERFPGEPLPFPECPFTGIHNHNDPPPVHVLTYRSTTMPYWRPLIPSNSDSMSEIGWILSHDLRESKSSLWKMSTWTCQGCTLKRFLSPPTPFTPRYHPVDWRTRALLDVSLRRVCPYGETFSATFSDQTYMNIDPHWSTRYGTLWGTYHRPVPKLAGRG